MNIYLSPEAIEVGFLAGRNSWNFNSPSSHREVFAVGCRALIQYILENLPELSAADKRVILGYNGISNTHNVQEQFSACLRLAFTPPTPDVPEKLVAVIDKHTALAIEKGGWTADMIRALACESAEVGK
jgi:hypothetical protein